MKRILTILLAVIMVFGMFAPVSADTSKAEDLKAELVAIIDNLPEKYTKETGKTAAEAKSIMDRLVEYGVTEDHIKTLTNNYGRYESHIALYNEWLNTKRNQDRVVINWTEKDNTHAADIFEFESAEVDNIPNKQGIVMKTENVLLPSNYTSGSYISFYSTDSAKTTYNGTFPDKFNEYYVNNGELTYGYSGISETIGQNTYNAGMVSQSYGFDIPFDGVTPYDEISILANSITYLGGETARQLPAIKTKVYFADGTTKEETSIVGNFGYGYRIALYSMLENDTMPYSERMSQRIKDNLGDMWYPTDVNVSDYFKLTDKSIRLYYSNGAKTIKAASTFGRASTINVDTDGKAVEKVSVTYATASDLEKMGGELYEKYVTQTTSGTVTNSEKNSANTYYVPINKEQLKNVTGYDANRDYYIAAIISDLYPVYLHGVTGVRTKESTYAEDISEIENKIQGFKDVFDGTEFNAMKDVERRISFLEKQGVSRASFDSALLEKLEYLLGGIVSENGHYEIYVSPNGDDNGYGSKAVPVQTLERAKEIARTYENDKPIDIILLEGEYNLTKTFELSEQDSGTEENPVTIKGAGGVITTADTLSYSDFEKVTEEEAGEKLQPKVIGNVLKLDLSKAGIDATDMPVFSSIYVRGDGYEDITFFVNDKEQNVAQYPNGESNYDTWVDLADTSISAGKIKVNASRAKKWQNEKFAYFEGYPAPDYSNERNNITIEEDLLCFKNPARFNLDEVHSRRYKVKHILYELDAPGEWYIDRDKNILYYYPTPDFNENSKIQIAARKLNAITTSSGLSNLYFDGVKFDKIRGDAIVAGSSNENVNVYNCEFTNISNIAVNYTARKNAPTLASVSNYTDAAENCEVRNNRFINIGCNAIRFIGGNRSTLSDGNNVIANNYIYNASDKQRCNAVISVSGAYNYVLNNEIHMGTFHAINFSGNENVIAHNELYNMLRDTGDCGVIYNGRHLATRGNQIAYNYIHDYKHLDKRTKDNGLAVYLDNRLSGTYIHHNIIFANCIGEAANGIQNGGGQHNIVNYNTIIDTDASITRTNRFVEDYVNNSESTAFDEIIRISGMPANETVILDNGYEKSYEMLGRNQLYFEKYPEMNDSIETLLNPEETVPKFVEKYPFILTLPEFSEGGKYGNLAEAIETGENLEKYSLLSLKSTIGNEYKGNIANSPWRAMDDKDVNGVVYDVYEKFDGVFEYNVQDASKDMFVDYENRDFRIKGSTNDGALDESFDMDKIGIQEDGSVSYNLDFELNDIETANPKQGIDKSFNVTYVDGSDKSNVFLMWERPVSSDYFTVEIATDENMSNKIYTNEDVYFSRLNVDLSKYEQNEFYFRVTARNIGRKGSQWENSDGVKTIKTLYSVSLDIYKDATVPFDITGSFNADLFSDEGEIVKSSNLTIGTYSGDMGMYNLTNFKKLVPSNGYYEYKDTVFHFPQVGYSTKTDNAIKTTNSETTTLSLKTEEKGNYDKIKLVMSSKYPAKDYEIIACYEDGTTDTFKVLLHQYYSTYNSYKDEAADIVMTVDGVNGEGTVISTLTSNLNKLYQTVLDTDENKVLTELKFVGGSGTVFNNKSNEEFIFAITGVCGDRTLENGNTMKAISMKNYTGADINANVIITGYIDGKFTSVIIPTIVKNNLHSGALNIEIPEKVEKMTNKAMFIWNRDFDVMKAFSEKLPLK